MASKTFVNKEIYIQTKHEFLIQETRLGGIGKLSWDRYIKNQDWGIICVDFFYDEYKITDEKKWFINKIKYGF